jgi:hypothetical protein
MNSSFKFIFTHFWFKLVKTNASKGYEPLRYSSILSRQKPDGGGVLCHKTVETEIATKRQLVVRFEVFTAVTMKNGVFWDAKPCDS